MAQRPQWMFPMVKPSALFPFLEWLPGYSTRHFKGDLFAGPTIALVLIPQSMAYAQLAGRPAFDSHTALTLLPSAVVITLLGFMEAISSAKAMAAKTGQRIDPNQELIGQVCASWILTPAGKEGSHARPYDL